MECLIEEFCVVPAEVSPIRSTLINLVGSLCVKSFHASFGSTTIIFLRRVSKEDRSWCLSVCGVGIER